MEYEMLSSEIDDVWARRSEIKPDNIATIEPAILETMRLLDSGFIRVIKLDEAGNWTTQEWIKKAILLWLHMSRPCCMRGGPVHPEFGETVWFDKLRPKFSSWNQSQFESLNFRVVTGAIVRYSAYISSGAVIMPSFINVGVRIGGKTMIDTWATIGSCAQIGENCHISGGAGIGGVLEPIQSNPVVIEDDCFIGARSEIVEGVHIEKGVVIGMGVFLSGSTKIVDRETGEIHIGRVPAYSVVVPGSIASKALPNGEPGPHLSCAVIVKRVDEQTRKKTAINDLLRD